MKMKWIIWICRLVLGGLFIWASVPKIISPPDFALMVFRYQILPYYLVNITAIMMPWVELFAGLSLLFVPKLRDAAAAIILGLLVVFTVAISINLVRGVDMNCGCFSLDASADKMTIWNVIRNVLLIGCGIISLFGERDRFVFKTFKKYELP